MGQSKGSQFTREPVVTPEQQSYLNQILQLSAQYAPQAAQGFQQFLPGGGGGDAIARAAQNRFQQQTIPQIQNSFGTDNKGSSALNQALAAGGANLNTDIASILAQMQLQAASGLGNLAQGQGALGAGTSQFALAPKQPSFLQQLLTGTIGQGGQLAGAYLGAPRSSSTFNFPGAGGQ